MPSPSETLLCQYRYDPLDRLVANALPDEPERQRFYCKSRLATEIHGAIGYSIVQHEDQLLAQQCEEDDSHHTALLAVDQQRSVLQMLKVSQSLQSFAYSPYGHCTPVSGLIGFNGERPDPVTGHYLLGNGHRAFDPALRKFMGPDKLSPFGRGGLNTYAYCGGNPITWRDPSGSFSVKTISALTREFGTTITYTTTIKTNASTEILLSSKAFTTGRDGLIFKTVVDNKLVVMVQADKTFTYSVRDRTLRTPRTLKELSHSRIAQHQLPDLTPHTLNTLTDLDDFEEVATLGNLTEGRASFLRATAGLDFNASRTTAKQEILTWAKNGEIRGVFLNPRRAKRILDRYENNGNTFI